MNFNPDFAFGMAGDGASSRGQRIGGEETPGQDFVTIAQFFEPTDAHIVRGCLVAAGVPAVVADAHLLQTDSLLTPALGGVRILVPKNHVQRGCEIIEAFNRGDYRLGDDVDVGEPVE